MNIRKTISLAVMAATSSLAFVQPTPADNDDEPGKVRSKIDRQYWGLGRKEVFIEVTDPDGIDWVKVYDTDGNGNKVGNDLTNGSKDFDCENDPPKLVEIFLDATSHGVHNHIVDFDDCQKNEEQWMADALTGTYIVGNDLIRGDQNSNTSMNITDMNLDGIPDIVVSDGTSRTVSIFVGNGDGSLQDPALAIDRVMKLPGLTADDLNLSVNRTLETSLPQSRQDFLLYDPSK